jgi:hypothetical protein
MLRPRTWASFWKIAASVAGVIGAAAAVYPLVFTDQQFVHLTYNQKLQMVQVDTLSEPIILTGNWYAKKKRWWHPNVIFSKGSISLAGMIAHKDQRIQADSRRHLALSTVLIDDCLAGDFEIGVEFKSKAGLAWARTTPPLCLAEPPAPYKPSNEPQKPFRWDEKRGLVRDVPDEVPRVTRDTPQHTPEEQRQIEKFRKELDALDAGGPSR